MRFRVKPGMTALHALASGKYMQAFSGSRLKEGVPPSASLLPGLRQPEREVCWGLRTLACAVGGRGGGCVGRLAQCG